MAMAVHAVHDEALREPRQVKLHHLGLDLLVVGVEINETRKMACLCHGLVNAITKSAKIAWYLGLTPPKSTIRGRQSSCNLQVSGCDKMNGNHLVLA